MKILVTGASGFIGSRTARRLADAGHDLRLLLRSTSKTHRLDGLKYERATGDITDKASLQAAAGGVDAVVHLACISAWSEIRGAGTAKLNEISVGGTRNVLEAAQGAGVKRVVYCSSVAAVNASERPEVFDEKSKFYPERPHLTYSVAKREAERVVASFAGKLDVVTVLPAEVYGPGDDAFVTAGNVRDVLTSWPTLACRGGTSVVHVDDVADGIVRALERGRAGERYILGGDNLSVVDLCRRVTKLAGMNRRVIELPNALARAACVAAVKVRLPPPLPLDVLEYATLFWFVDSSKARRELGFAPRDADATLGPVVAWLKEAGHV